MTPPSTRSDRELLTSFVKTADGAAFATLTERHLGLVFGTACRRTRSREMAQEAAQNTFCRLARHAPRIWVGNSLAPWLHAVALREAGTLMRAEAARQRALDRLAAFTSPEDSAASPSAPPPGSEHLDEALASLPEAARRILILRYLQGLSLREVACEEDTSEEAARKRITRALERLTHLLARRGVTASAVTACLAAAPVLWPAPSAAALAGRALKQAAAPAGAGLSGVAGFALSQWPVAAVFLLAAVPAAWPWGLGLRRAETVFNPATEALSHPPEPERMAENASKSPNEVIAGLRRELGTLGAGAQRRRSMSLRFANSISVKNFSEWKVDPARLAAVRSAVMDFSLEEVKASSSLPESETGLIDGVIYSRWAELELEAARQAAVSHAERTKSQDALLAVLSVQVSTDPEGAVRWAMDHAPMNCRGYAPEKCREMLVRRLLEPMRPSDPRGYLRLMRLVTPADPPQSPDHAALVGILPYAPAIALEGLLEHEKQGRPLVGGETHELVRGEELQPKEAAFMVSYAGQLPADSELRRACLRTAAFVFAHSEPVRAMDLMAAAQPIGVKAEADWLTSMTYLLRDWKDTDPAAAAHWLNRNTELDPDIQSDLARKAGLLSPVLVIPDPPTTP
ncbi:MAG: sigma-70 family RNA polymerase sigma factor [Verrucomicrobiota bacterium]